MKDAERAAQLGNLSVLASQSDLTIGCALHFAAENLLAYTGWLGDMAEETDVRRPSAAEVRGMIEVAHAIWAGHCTHPLEFPDLEETI